MSTAYHNCAGPVPSQESERPCTSVLLLSIFYEFPIGCWYCFDNVVVFACFSFYYLTSREILSKQIEILYKI